MTEDQIVRDDQEPADGAMPVPAGPGPMDVEPAPEPQAEPPVAGRPDGIPEKFWDPEANTVRTEALIKSYCELERKLGRMVPLPGDEADISGNERLRKALGVPDAADGYQIEVAHDVIQPDAEVNARLHEAGFSQRQAQMVYDLAADYVVPLVNQAIADVAAQRDAERLAARFGGDEQWRTLSTQIKTWGQANLPPETMDVLGSSYEGVLAMHQMMQASEPAVLHGAETPGGAPSESELAAMMRDPRYWRDRDPALIDQVTAGYRRLYSK